MVVTSNWMVFGVFLVAAVFVAARWISMKEESLKTRLTTRMGSPQWDISQSWVANLTVLGGLLGVLAGASDLLPTELQFLEKSKQTYLGLSVFFGSLAIVGPFVYVALQRNARPHTRTRQRSFVLKGYVWTFLLATTVALWAVWGQLGTTFFLALEVANGRPLPGPVLVVFIVVIVIAVGLVGAYAWAAVPVVIHEQTQVERHVAEVVADMRLIAATDAVEAAELAKLTRDKKAIEPPLPHWSVL